MRSAVAELCTTRGNWKWPFYAAVESGAVKRGDLPPTVIRALATSKNEKERQKAQQERSARPVLKGTPRLWRKNPENLTGKEAAEIKELQGKHLATARAYQMRLVLQDISRLPDQTSARQKSMEISVIAR